MGKVETGYSHPVSDEFVNHFFGVGGWTEGADYFGHAAEGGGDFFEGMEGSFLEGEIGGVCCGCLVERSGKK